MMKPIQWILGVAIMAAWLSWDFTCVCVRTFVLGNPIEQQLAEIQQEDEA